MAIRKTHKQIVAKHLREYGTINTVTAITNYHITRLAAVIYDLRQEGWPIDTVDFKGHRYPNYVLLPE